jgi:DNA-binding LytR/AlgR family response regulator
MDKLKCVIVDDNEHILGMLQDYCQDSPIAEIVAVHNSPQKFLKVFPELNFDLVLLDICMPRYDGFDVAKAIYNKPIIFITGVPDVLQEATLFAPIDLIYKPVSKERLNKGLEKAYKLLKGNSNSIFKEKFQLFHLLESEGQVKIKPEDIIYVKTDEKDRRHKHVVLKNGERHTISHATLDELLAFSSALVQVNKKELISLDAFHTFDIDRVSINGVTENGATKWIIVGRRYKNEFKERIGLK